MSKSKPTQSPSMDDLISYLRARLDTILVTWRTQCEADKKMPAKASFSREEFNDQVPVLLEILLQRLAGEQPAADPVTIASEHGLHRWQSGYALPELIIEIEHLADILLKEIAFFTESHPNLPASSIVLAHQIVFKIIGEANKGSISYYNQLMQNDAAERANSLQFALNQLQELGQQRGKNLRQSSHDIRASFGLLSMASKMLELPGAEKDRVELVSMLNRNLSSIKEMLLQLTDYARIESGQDELEIKKVAVGKLIQETIQTALPAASQYKIELLGTGPDALEVMTDRVKVQRILINLLHNALKNTRKGGIYVTWGMETPLRWTLSVQDTGTGFSKNSPAALLAEQLKPALETSASHQSTPLFENLPSSSPEALKESEGLGLFIVKKLCELMKASMDIESHPDRGTLIRIRFPNHQTAD